MSKFEKYTSAATLALALFAGTTACTANTPGAGTSARSYGSCEPGFFTDIRVIGAAKDGGMNAVNVGECGAIYDPIKQQRLGEIATGDAFIIICNDGPKPPSLVVTHDGITGNVNYGTSVGTESVSPYAGVPVCNTEPV